MSLSNVEPEDTGTTPVQEHELPIPSFSHIPPKWVKGRRRWPTSLEAQGFPTHQVPKLHDVLVWIMSYLEPVEKGRLTMLGTEFRYGPGFGPLWFYRPWSPNRRRRWGFGVPAKTRTVVNDIPPPHLYIHGNIFYQANDL
jgi:hypothetical protein